MAQQSSSSTFGGALYDILLQKREEARQRLLDEAHIRDVDSSIKARDDQAETNRMYREAQSENMKSQAADRFLKRFHKDQDVDPDTYGQAKDLDVQYAFKAPIPGMGPDFQGPMPEGQVPGETMGKFLGSPAEIDADQKRTQLNAWLDGPEGQALKTDDPEVWAAYKSQAMSEKFGVTVPAGAYNKPKPLPGEAILLPDNTYMFNGQKVKTVPPGTHITRGFDPNRRSNSASEGTATIQQIEDPKNPGHMISVWVNGKAKTIEPVTVPGALAPQPKEVPTPDTSQPAPPANQQFTPGSGAGDVPIQGNGPNDPRLTTTEPAAGPQVFSRTVPPKAPTNQGITSAEVNGVRAARSAAFKGPQGAVLPKPSPVGVQNIITAITPIIYKLPDQWMQSDLITKDPAMGMSLLEAAINGLISADDIIKNEEQPTGEVLTPGQEANLRRVLAIALGQF